MDYRKSVNLPQTDFPQRAGLPAQEPGRLARWEKMDLYGKTLEGRDGAPRFELHDGPPYSNGQIHLGHAFNKILKDMILRYHVLLGERCRYQPGWDNHGLPIEYAVFKQFKEAGKDMSDVVAVRRACRKYATKWIDIQRDGFKRLGVRGDWEHPYLTMDPKFEASILESFAALAKQGYVYRGKRIVQWAPTLQTALADAEIEYKEDTTPSIYVAFPVTKPSPALADCPDCSVVIWTTTPWTIPANLCIAVGEDLEYRVVKANGKHYVFADAHGDELCAKFGWTDAQTVKVVFGKDLDGCVTRHPLYDQPSPIVFADYVTLDDGTGCVHTAPGHGKDDFETGKKYGLPPYCPVDEKGCYTDEVGPRLAGMFVFKANKPVCEWLKEVGALLAEQPFKHLYPHDWRAHEPIIFRATTQWFLDIDHDRGGITHRQLCLDEIGRVKWYPPEGEERIRAMVSNRPDWCLSRQRVWGMGIPAFTCPCGETIMDARSLDFVVSVVREKGSDAWFELPPEQLLPADYVCPKCGAKPATFRKETDVLDVWFDSGSTHRACYRDDELPVDVYLEGSDQHRGWFNSSLMVGVGVKGESPYKAVITHGFLLDEHGKAMSKSAGNGLAPSEICDKFGADVLRLWVASADFFQDVTMSKDVISRVTDTYRSLRNSFRFLLGNLHDFDPATDKVELAKLSGLDRYVLHRLEAVKAEAKSAYEAFAFHRLVSAVHGFALEVSATYLDVAKDELYCGLPWGPARRGIQTVLFTVCSELARVLSPVLAFTMDEVWDYLPGDKKESVHLEDWPAAAPERVDDALAADFAVLLKAREVVKHAQEDFNADKGKADKVNPLEMAVTLTAPASDFEVLTKWAEEARALCVVSALKLESGDELSASCARAEGHRCARSWRVFPDAEFGHVAGHPTLSDRDGAVVVALAERGLIKD